MSLLNNPQHKAERKRQNTLQKERLRARFEQGDPFLRKTIFGNIKPVGLVIPSAEGARFAYSHTPLPEPLGEAVVHDSVPIEAVEAETGSIAQDLPRPSPEN